MTFAVVEASRDRAAVWRAIVAAALTGMAITAVLSILKFGQIAAPSVVEPQPITPGVAAPPTIVPPKGSIAGRQLVVPTDSYGQCYIDARINGARFKALLLDSGAADYLVFGSNNARQLGFEPSRLAYNQTYGSANGEGQQAIVRIREFRIEGLVLHDVTAAITEAPQSVPLLGAQILRLVAFQLKGDHCELTLP